MEEGLRRSIRQVQASHIGLNSSDLDVGECEVLPTDWNNGVWQPTVGIFYFQCVISNMESMDGLMLTKDQKLVFFQITNANLDHSVKMKGLHYVYEQFKCLADSCMLVFVVQTSSAITKVQPLLDESGRKWRRTKRLDTPITRLQNEQFVLAFDALDLNIKKAQSS